MTNAQIFKAAHEMANQAIQEKQYNWMWNNSDGTYKSIFKNALLAAHKIAAKDRQPVQKFFVKTPYGDRNCYYYCKKLNGIWNGKTWEISCKQHELGMLEQYVVKYSGNSNTYNTGLGFYGTAADARRGFDGIE